MRSSDAAMWAPVFPLDMADGPGRRGPARRSARGRSPSLRRTPGRVLGLSMTSVQGINSRPAWSLPARVADRTTGNAVVGRPPAACGTISRAALSRLPRSSADGSAASLPRPGLRSRGNQSTSTAVRPLYQPHWGQPRGEPFTVWACSGRWAGRAARGACWRPGGCGPSLLELFFFGTAIGRSPASFGLAPGGTAWRSAAWRPTSGPAATSGGRPEHVEASPNAGRGAATQPHGSSLRVGPARTRQPSQSFPASGGPSATRSGSLVTRGAEVDRLVHRSGRPPRPRARAGARVAEALLDRVSSRPATGIVHRRTRDPRRPRRSRSPSPRRGRNSRTRSHGPPTVGERCSRPTVRGRQHLGGRAGRCALSARSAPTERRSQRLGPRNGPTARQPPRFGLDRRAFTL